MILAVVCPFVSGRVQEKWNYAQYIKHLFTFLIFYWFKTDLFGPWQCFYEGWHAPPPGWSMQRKELSELIQLLLTQHSNRVQRALALSQTTPVKFWLFPYKFLIMCWNLNFLIYKTGIILFILLPHRFKMKNSWYLRKFCVRFKSLDKGNVIILVWFTVMKS